MFLKVDDLFVYLVTIKAYQFILLRRGILFVMETKNISFSARELTFLVLALSSYRKDLVEKEPDSWYEDLLTADWLHKKIKEATLS